MSQKKLVLGHALKFLFVAIIVLTTSLSSFNSSSAASKNRPEPSDTSGQIIIKFKSSSLSTQEFSKKHEIQSLNKILNHSNGGGLDRLYLANVPGRSQDVVLADLNNDPNVEYAEPNYVVKVLLTPNDPGFNQLWGLHNTGQSGGTSDADIDAIEAWNTRIGTDLVVGVIDTGIDYNHPDLVDNIWTNPGEIPNNGVDDDGNGYVDDVHGWDFVNNDNDPMDDYGHGTHVAGTIAARGDNNIGVAGVNWSGKVAALKFLSSAGTGTTDNAIRALQYANQKGFKITNNSWGGGAFSQALYDAISAANTAGNLFVAAAGNDGMNTDITPAYPASYDLSNIISVAATDRNDALAGFSNYGITSVDLGAPGVAIYSTVPSGTCTICDPTGYKSINGTSMATPHVSGAAAFLWSLIPNLTNFEIKNELLNKSDRISALNGKAVSGGRLNLNGLIDRETDNVPPAAVTNLAVQSRSYNSVTLSWTATGDDGQVGQASHYDIRYSTAPINDSNFSSATPAYGEPFPSTSGTIETGKVNGLLTSTNYYFAMKVYDNLGNVSGLSNVVSRATTAISNAFYDEMEGGVNGWTVTGTSTTSGGPSLWHLSQRRAYSPTNSWYYGQESSGNYSTGFTNFGVIYSPEIDLTNFVGSQLRFDHFLATEGLANYDKAEVRVKRSIDGSEFLLLKKIGTGGAWIREVFDLSAFDGQKIKILFSFDTVDANFNTQEGWFIDNVVVYGSSTVDVPSQNLPPTANAGPDKIVNAYSSVTFDGGASTDIDGTIVSYLWSFPDGTTANGKIISQSFNNPGIYNVILSVTDDKGGTNQDTVKVTVNPVAPVEVFKDSFKNPKLTPNWTQDSQNDWTRLNNSGVDNIGGSAKFTGPGNNSQLISPAISLQGRIRAHVYFNWKILSEMDLGEYLAMDVSTNGGASWSQMAIINGDIDAEGPWFANSVSVQNVTSSSIKFRFRGSSNLSNEQGFVDLVSVDAY